MPSIAATITAANYLYTFLMHEIVHKFTLALITILTTNNSNCAHQ
jgi:hypothetical protein